jgi:Carboxypeptidase regulatory-like domain/TonB dependent receptor
MGRLACVLFFATCLCAPNAIAQTDGTGALSGFVKDSSGALVAGAAVTITSTQTGQTRSTVTGTSGTYSFSLLPPGTYKVVFAAKGFKTLEVASAVVNVTETDEVDGTLEVGSMEQSVTVSGTSEEIQRETATVGTLVDSKEMVDLPLTTRNYTQVLSMSAGVTSDVTNAANLGQGSSTLNVNGNINSGNNFQMDGQQTNNFGSGTANASLVFYAEIAIPNPDAIEEFKIQTSQYDAGSGRNPGANVEVVTKSGTNSLHGAAWEFLRNTDLDANDFFRNRSDLPRAVMRQNQFGFSVGGPILKNKLFFFGSYQGTRQVNGLSSVSTSTPFTPPQLFGVDRATATAATYGAIFCNVNGGKGVNGGAVACDGSNINPVSLMFLQQKLPNGQYWIPNPQTPSGSSIFSEPSTFNEDQFVANVDYVISPRNTLSAKVFHSHDPQVQTIDCGASCLPGNPGLIDSGTFNGVLKWTSIITPNLVNEARAGFTHLYWEDSSSQFVTPQDFGVIPLNNWLNELPTINVNGLFSLGGSITDNGFSAPTTYMIGDHLSWSRGKQTIRFGFEAEDVRFLLGVGAVARGTLTFASFNDFLLATSAAGNGTAGTANPRSNIATTSPLSDISVPGGVYSSFRIHNQSAFAQDDIKLTPRLTVNVGLRWEYFGGMSNALGFVGNLSTNLLNSVPVPPPGGTLVGYDVASNFPGTPPAGVVRRPTPYGQEERVPIANFAPRVGFAWQPLSTPRFVVRGGFGIYNQETNGNVLFQPLNNQPPNVVNIGLSNALQPAATFQDPWPVRPPLGFVNRVVPQIPSQVSTSGFLGPWQTPKSYIGGVNVQYEFVPNWVLDVGYVGNRSEHIVISAEANNIPALASPLNPIVNPQDGSLITANTPSNAFLRVPWIGFAPMGVSCVCTNGDSNYNGLQVTVRHQFSHGFTFQAAYTYSRTMDDFVGLGGNLNGNSNNPENLAQEYAAADFDRANRLIFSYNYQFPSFRNGEGIRGKALTGWSVAGVTTMQTGEPLTFYDPTAGTAFYGATNVSSRAQYCPGITSADLGTPGSVEHRLGGYVNPNAFCAPPIVSVGGPGTTGTDYGNSGRSVLRGPGQNNFDISIVKTTRVGGLSENASLDFRTEFFNAFNHAQFGNPGDLVDTASLGIINSTTVAPRLIQFALKYVF